MVALGTALIQDRLTSHFSNTVIKPAYPMLRRIEACIIIILETTLCRVWLSSCRQVKLDDIFSVVKFISVSAMLGYRISRE